MLAIRSIIVVFVLFCWKTSKKFLLTFERKTAALRQFFLNLKMLQSHSSVAHDLTHVQSLMQKLNDSIRVDSTQTVRCVVDSTNWKVDLRDI